MNDLLDTTPMVTMESFYDYYQDSEAMYQRTSLVIWGLCGFIMLFAVIDNDGFPLVPGQGFGQNTAEHGFAAAGASPDGDNFTHNEDPPSLI